MVAIKNYFSMEHFNALKLRVMIFLFLYLALGFSRLFIFASSRDYPEFAILSIVFFDATVIIIFNLLYGDKAIGRDVNTLNCYGLICHLIYVPLYFSGYQAAIYHNTAIKVINAVIVLRLCYFGDRELLSGIALIERAKAMFLNNRRFFSRYINGLIITLFFMCAIPLSALIYIINTDEMRMMGIAVILFTFFIAIEFSKNRNNIQKPEAEVLTTTGLSYFDFEALEASRSMWSIVAKILGIILVAASIFYAILVRSSENTYFSYGYSAGYSDGKNGKAVMSKEHTEKLLECYRYDSGNIPHLPQDTDCKNIDRSNWK